MYIILYSVVIIYIISILLYIIGNLLSVSNIKSTECPSISVIVAVKDGELSLPNILNDLEQQNYHGNYECIIVDDQSSDATKHIIQTLEQKNNKFKYASSANGDQRLSFKKRALDAGIRIASHEILLFTDVDCRLQNTWISSMSKCFKKNVDYVIGYSEVSKPYNLVSWFQKIDLLMMFAAGRGMCNLNMPFASIGQNQAYRKNIYKKIGFLDIKNSIQGDDTLFLQLCLQNNINVIFNDSKKSFVQSRTEKKVSCFLKQRIRWAGDANVMWHYNKNLFIIIVATFLINLFIIVLMLDMGLSKLFNPYILYGMIISKLIIEGILYIVSSIKFKSNIKPIMFIYWFIIEVPYVVLMGIGSFFVQHIGWKGKIS
tara:strand:- start:2115 stop:3230 length:1116 start_codon:yes stop_codon:yes gene_type:complete